MALNRLTDMGWYILNPFPHQNEILTCSHVATHKQHKGRGKVTRLNWKQKQQQKTIGPGGGKAAVYFVSLNSKQTTKKKKSEISLNLLKICLPEAALDAQVH